MTIVKETLVVGLMVAVVGTIIGGLVGKLMSVDLPPVCKDWNKNYVMEVCLFLTGCAVHILCEVTGLNGWYCRNGNACKMVQMSQPVY